MYRDWSSSMSYSNELDWGQSWSFSIHKIDIIDWSRYTAHITSSIHWDVFFTIALWSQRIVSPEHLDWVPWAYFLWIKLSYESNKLKLKKLCNFSENYESENHLRIGIGFWMITLRLCSFVYPDNPGWIPWIFLVWMKLKYKLNRVELKKIHNF